MRHDPDIEYFTLEGGCEKPAKQRGFLSRLFHCLTVVKVTRFGQDPASSSGEEVEEDVIEF